MASGAPAMTEAALQDAVASLVRLHGLLAYHTYDSRRSGPGFPDLVIVGTGGHLFRELKTRTGKLTEAQRKWGDHLQAAGANWAVWRPEDLASGRIQTELKAIR